MTIALAVHGGAGPALRGAERAMRLEAGLRAALDAGHAVLAGGGAAIDAVEAAVVVLEEHGGFNAGRGGVATESGDVELDASIMNGYDRALGAVAALRSVPTPVRVARAVLAEARHALLAGEGALAFAREHGLALDPAASGAPTPTPAPSAARDGDTPSALAAAAERVRAAVSPGTVGAVALDADGHLAAATSTGGRTGQRIGRVGDSPVPGAGIWADDATAAISCTGDGEAFMRAGVAHEVDALMRHRGLPLDIACRVALRDAGLYGGEGGLIALDVHGHLAMPFTSPAMRRGHRIGLGPVRIVVE